MIFTPLSWIGRGFLRAEVQINHKPLHGAVMFSTAVPEEKGGCFVRGSVV